MDRVWALLVVALAVEALWETVKLFRQEGKWSWDRLWVVILAVVVALAAGADLFAAVGVDLSFPWLAGILGETIRRLMGSLLGTCLTGLILSRGANAVHDLLLAIERLRTQPGPQVQRAK